MSRTAQSPRGIRGWGRKMREDKKEMTEKGKHILFTPEEREECKKRYIAFSQKESKIERILRRERNLAPRFYLI
jgi:hypothetical protein